MGSVNGSVGSRLVEEYDVEAFFNGGRFFFAIKQRSGFAWMSTEEAENFQLGKDAK